tara:strand:+ start:112 stop:1047 length:936 start_codon:yes stop_codon:yes gene_type:complete
MLDLTISGSMAKKLDGKKLAKEIENRLKEEIATNLSIAGRPPGLAVLRVGDDAASGVYVANKEKACARIGMKSFGSHIQGETSTGKLAEVINELNQNENIDGILLQLPVPVGIDDALLLKVIDPSKDADGLHTLNLGRLLKGEIGPRSCTPAGIMALLSRNKINLEGKRVVVIGRSILVGQPMALMLQAANATVTVAHSKTKNLTELTKEAEILVVAAGKAQMIGKEHIRPDAVVVDVGIHRVPCETLNVAKPTYKLCGDVRSGEVESIASALSPVPGGVGPMTVAMLLVNTVSRWQEHCGLSLTLKDLLP